MNISGNMPSDLHGSYIEMHRYSLYYSTLQLNTMSAVVHFDHTVVLIVLIGHFDYLSDAWLGMMVHFVVILDGLIILWQLSLHIPWCLFF